MKLMAQCSFPLWDFLQEVQLQTYLLSRLLLMTKELFVTSLQPRVLGNLAWVAGKKECPPLISVSP